MSSSSRADAEAARLAELQRYDLAAAGPDQALEDLAALAAQMCGVSMAAVAVAAPDGQWMRSGAGRDSTLPPGIPCPAPIDDPAVFVVPDTVDDARFAGSVWVESEPRIRFYAAAPLVTPGGHIIGTLSVMDRAPRDLAAPARQALAVLGRQVMAQLNLRRQAADLAARERLLAAIVESEPECVKLLGPDNCLLMMNRAGLEMIEADSLADLGARSVLPLIAPADRPAFKALTAAVFRGESGTLTFELIGLKGSRRWLETSATPLRDDEGAVTALLGITRDITSRRRAEADLHENEERLRLALDAARMGTYDWDVASDRVTWSRGHEQLWGYAPGEFSGTFAGFAERVHPDDLPAIRDLIRECMDARRPFDHEFRIVWPDGRVHWVHSRGEFAFDGATAVRMRGVTSDVTGRRAVEDELRLSNERFEFVGRATNDAVWDWDMTRGTVVWNEGFQRLFGYRPEELEAGVESWTARLHPDDRTRIRESVTAVLEGGSNSWSGEYRFRRRDGGYADVLDRGFIIRDGAGTAVRMVGAMLDVTARKHAEGRIRHLNRVYAVLTDVNQLIVRVHRSEVLLETACRIAVDTGGFRMAWIGMIDDVSGAFGIRAHAGADEGTLRVLQGLLAGGIETGCAFTHTALQTAQHCVCNDIARDPRAAPWRDAALARDYRAMAAFPLQRDGRVIGTFNLYASEEGFFDADEVRLLDDLAADISFALDLHARERQREQLEEQFRQAQKMESVGRLAGGIAHDFNNLLTVISSTADLATETLPLSSPLHADLDQISAAAGRAADLTRQLLALSRQQILKPEILNLSEVAGRMEGMLRRVIGEDIELVFDLDASPGSIRADPGQIEQVMLNLAVNARDAMVDGGTLRIETADVAPGSLDDPSMPEQAYVMVCVSDTGAGMEDAVRERIFEPFFTTKEIGKGTGLGLSTVYGIVKQSGGSISVSSEPGKGTTFSLYFPRVDASPGAADRTGMTAAPHGTETILLVEDELVLRGLARRILSGAGYHVLEAASGPAALEVLQAHDGPLHLVLTDVVMPGMNGRELADRLKALRRDLKVLYTSGHTDDAIFRHGVLDDPRRFLGKPYRPAELKAKVRQVLDE